MGSATDFRRGSWSFSVPHPACLGRCSIPSHRPRTAPALRGPIWRTGGRCYLRCIFRGQNCCATSGLPRSLHSPQVATAAPPSPSACLVASQLVTSTCGATCPRGFNSSLICCLNNFPEHSGGTPDRSGVKRFDSRELLCSPL